MRDRLIEKIDNFCKKELGANFNKEIIENFADDLIADGWIRPPCKVGDVVYLTTDCTGDMERIVTGFRQDAILSYAMILPMSELGKTLFLTREEAEKALQEVKGK